MFQEMIERTIEDYEREMDQKAREFINEIYQFCFRSKVSMNWFYFYIDNDLGEGFVEESFESDDEARQFIIKEVCGACRDTSCKKNLLYNRP